MFDPTTGQLYTERIEPFHSSSGNAPGTTVPFTHRAAGAPPPTRSCGTGPGAGSLQDMCVRRFLNSLDALETQSLEGVPQRILELLEGGVRGRGLESIRIWQIFTQAHPKTPPHHHKAFTRDHVLDAPLSALPSQLGSPNLHWLTTLTLSNTTHPPDSMLHLASLSNLVSLHVTSNDTRSGQSLDDDVFRRWSRQASTSQGFPLLQTMFLRFQSGITSHAFEFLDGFPRLRMLCTSRCSVVIKEAKGIIKDKGWKMSKHDFYAYIRTAFDDPRRGLGSARPWLPQVDRYTMMGARSFGGDRPDTPLLCVQLGSRNGAREAGGTVYGVNEVECYVKDGESVVEGRARKRKCEHGDQQERDQEKDSKKRKIRDGKKVELLGLLQAM